MLLLRGNVMSRSYKKVPCYKDYNRGMKKRANRHLRRNYLDIPSGRAYKNYFVPMIFVITDFSGHSVLIKSGYQNLVMKHIQTMNYIECGINIIK